MATAPNFEVPANVGEELKKMAVKYRQDLIKMPTIGLKKTLQYMTLRPGIRVSEVVSELQADAQLAPYDESRVDKANVKIIPRELVVYLGSVAQEFSPNSVYSTVWGSNTMHGEALKNVPISLQVLQLLALQLGKNLNSVVFNAVRNATGTTSKDLFNGFDTIAKTEYNNGTLSEDLGNLFKISDVLGTGVTTINDDNAVDVAQAICEAASEELMDEQLNLIVPRSFMNLYNRAYLKKFGPVPYNNGYSKQTVEGFDNVTLAPLGNKKDSPFFQLTPRSNMLIGVNEAQNSDKETINVEKYSPWKLTFEATKYFGCQYESINKERILFATIDGSTPMISKGE